MRENATGPARLLVVDDNKVNRLLLTRSLELQGHRVATAENGRVALEMLRRESFDLLLLDMEMPEMDGFQVLEQMAGDLQLRDLPVIVTSSLEGIANVVRCIELGAEDYLPKPVNPVLLKARLGASLEKKRLRDQQKEWMRRFATREVAQDLQVSGFALGGKHVHGAVMFTDIRGFTALAETQPPEETIELLNTYYTLMFDAIASHGGVVTMMAGDGLMAVFGAPLPLRGPLRGRRAHGTGDDRDDRALQPGAGRRRQAPDQDRHRHRFRRDGGRIHRHQRARDLHLHRRHGQSGIAARGAHQSRRAHDSDRRRDPRSAGRSRGGGAARSRCYPGQGGAGGRFFGEPRAEAVVPGRPDAGAVVRVAVVPAPAPRDQVSGARVRVVSICRSFSRHMSCSQC